MLFVADEVITGYGRIGGAWFASTRFGLEPDMVTTAKGLTSGYVPMGAVLVAPAGGRAVLPARRRASGGGTATPTPATRRALPSRWPTSTSSSGRACSTRPPGWRPRCADAAPPLAEHDAVREVRCGTGALAAVQLADPADAPALAKALRAHGVATRAVGAGGIQISPAFVMTDDQVDELAAAIGRAVDRL